MAQLLHLRIGICCVIIWMNYHQIFTFDCNELMNADQMENINREYLKNCLPALDEFHSINDEITAQIWRLIRTTNDGIENVPIEWFQAMGNFIIKIPLNDLENLTINGIDWVRLFGKIDREFNDKQLNLIAEKIHNEWTTKQPDKFSQYDLIALGQILCYYNITEIAQIHAGAFKLAIKVIGKLRNCPSNIIREFAKLAVQADAFGSPNTWSRIDVSLIDNVLNGLELSEYSAIDPSYFNRNCVPGAPNCYRRMETTNNINQNMTQI